MFWEKLNFANAPPAGCPWPPVCGAAILETFVVTTGATVFLSSSLLQDAVKINNAKSAGAYGSGTPMLGTNVNETVIFIIVIAVIFGGVAGAFFLMGRSKKREVAK